MSKHALLRSHTSAATPSTSRRRRGPRALAAGLTAALAVTLLGPMASATAASTSASDSFKRSVSSGWGSADKGGSWSVAHGTHSVGSNAGRQVLGKAGASAQVNLAGYSATSTDLRTIVALDKAPRAGAAYLSLVGRDVGSSDYRARLQVQSSGATELVLSRGETRLTSVRLPDDYTSGTKMNLRLQVNGTKPTKLRANAWKAGTSTPSGWMVETTDSTSALQKAGGLGMISYLSSGATNAPVTVSWSALSAEPVGSSAPKNVAPKAALEITSNGLKVSADGSGSTDSDGSVKNYHWDFGAGSGDTATGKTASFTYPKAGTYTVQLTVTDDDGATNTAKKSITVKAPAATGTKPGASNTGARSSKLTVHRGDIVVTQPGTVIEGLDVYGFITVKAADVTIRDSRVRGSGPGSFNTGLINANDRRVKNLLVEDVTLVPDHPSVWINGMLGHDYTARRVNTWNVVDGFGIYNIHGTAANVTVESSYVHDLAYFSPDPNHSDNQTHNDAIQIQGGSNIKIVGNTLSARLSKTAGTQNYRYPEAGFGIILTPNVNAVTSSVIERNWLDGSHIPIKLVTNSKVPSMDFGVVRDNRFARDMRNVPMGGQNNWFTILTTPNLKAATSGNVYDDDGSPVTVRRDSGTGTAP